MINIKNVKESVTKVSGHRGNKHYEALCYAVYAAYSYRPNEPQMEIIRNEAGKAANTNANAVSRAVGDIWDNGDKAILSAIYGHPLIERPSPKDPVLIPAQHLRIHKYDDKSKPQTV